MSESKHTPGPVWLIQFDDYDRRPEIITDEAAARERFRRISDSWNAHLFVKVQSNSRDCPFYAANATLASPDLAAEVERLISAPIDMVLHCPACGMQHIDAPEPAGEYTARGYDPLGAAALAWNNPPHRSHLCHGCGHIWRPADVATNGVAAVKTKGKADAPVVSLAAEVQRLSCIFGYAGNVICQQVRSALQFGHEQLPGARERR
jgi:hypothetical protein